MPSKEELWDNLSYNPLTGELFWRVRRGARALPGDRVGSIDSRGYYVTKWQGKHHKNHRLVYKWVTGDEPGELLDHINKRRDDNSWHNLREVDRSINTLNTDTTKGYFYDKRDKNWVAILRRKGKQWRVYCKTENEAIIARQNLMREFAPDI